MLTQEQRDRATAILTEAETLITAGEHQRGEAKLREFDRLVAGDGAADLADQRRKLGGKLPETVVAGKQDLDGDDRPGDFGPTSTTGVRALGDDETFASWAASRGHKRPACGLGGWLRAITFGARNESEEEALSLSSRSQMLGSGTLGGFLVPETLVASVIDPLRAETAVLRAGARRVPIGPETKFPVQTGDPVVSTHGENQEISTTEITFGRYDPPIYTFSCIVKASREVVEDAPMLEERVSSSFASAAALEVDRVALYGQGAALEPGGVKSFSGANVVDLAGTKLSANGWYDTLLNLRGEILDDNGGEPTGYIVNPREERAFSKLKDGQGLPYPIPPALAGMQRFSTTQVRKNQGTGSNESDIFMGAWNRLEILVRIDVGVTVLRERYADSGQLGYWLWLRFGVLADHDERFGYVSGILPE